MSVFDRFSDRYQRRQEREKAHREQLPTEDEPALPPPVDPIRKEKVEPKRNDPCPCGSGKKYKQCCLKKEGK
jgi:uncharacterized protein YecA (UPF0149 family)